MHVSEGNGKLAVDVGKIEARSAKLGFAAQLCGRVGRRLRALLGVLSTIGADARARVAADFEQAVAEFLHALRLQIHYGFALYWVATSQRLVADVCRTHKRVDELYERLGVEELDPELAQWRATLTADRAEQVAWLEAQVEGKSSSVLINQVFGGPTKLKETLATLASQLELWAVDSGEGDASGASFSGELMLSEKQARLMRETLERVARDGDQGEVFDWFIPQDDVKRDRTTAKEGTFGSLYEGTLMDRKTRERRRVAIKHLDSGMSALDDNRQFSRELTSWSMLEHEHILRMLGANHVSSPKFFVSELATEGNFVEFFGEAEENRRLLWHMFIQAAQGLEFLHRNKVEHGGIKCTNLLLTKPEGGDASQIVVKLSDFGMSIVRAESVSVSVSAKSQALRYKAPERLTQASGPGDFCRSDIYSLGLSIIDAATGEPAFGMASDEEVIAAKFNGDPIERPETGFTDREWALVASMCESDPVKRPDLDAVINEMKELDTLRADAGAVETEGA